jgi:Fe-S-cluster containining protein
MGKLKMKKKRAKKTTKPECGDCPAMCCHNLSIKILKPRTRDEIEELKWHLHYDTVQVYILNKRWHLYVQGRCRYLDSKNLCTIYGRRPDKCRQHNPPDCERFVGFYDVMLSTPEELERHLRK